MSKNGPGHKFNLTEKRLEFIFKELNNQATLPTIANKLGIHYKTLSSKLIEMGIDIKEMRNTGRQSLRQVMFETIFNIKDEAKRVQMGLAYLEKYPIIDIEEDNSKALDEEIAKKILDELSASAKKKTFIIETE